MKIEKLIKAQDKLASNDDKNVVLEENHSQSMIAKFEHVENYLIKVCHFYQVCKYSLHKLVKMTSRRVSIAKHQIAKYQGISVLSS